MKLLTTTILAVLGAVIDVGKSAFTPQMQTADGIDLGNMTFADNFAVRMSDIKNQNRREDMIAQISGNDAVHRGSDSHLTGQTHGMITGAMGTGDSHQMRCGYQSLEALGPSATRIDGNQ